MFEPEKLFPEVAEGCFLCERTAFLMIANQTGVINPGQEFVYNGYKFKLDNKLGKGQVIGVGETYAAIAQRMVELIKQGKI